MRKYISALSLLLFFSLTVSAQNSYPVFSQAPKESYVKAMKTVFEDLYYRKWEKAQKDLLKVETKYDAGQKQALFPLPQAAQAILLSTENTMVPTITPDYDKAYYLLKQVLAYKDQAGLTTFLSDPKVNVNLNVLQDKIEGVLCDKATKTNTEAAYDAIIDSLLPQSLQLQKMKMQREDLVYDAVSKNPTEAECERFLSKYTTTLTSRKTRVIHDLDSIRYSTVGGTADSLQNFIAKNPNSTYLKTAQDRLEALEYAQIDTTAASCRAFLDKYPSSQHFMEVKKRYTDYAYREAMDSHSGAAYLQYCKDFPYDVHYQDIFDSLMCRTLRQIYDTVFVGGKPDVEKYLSSAFCQSVKNRDAAEEQMRADGLIPPARKDIWTGLKQGTTPIPYNCMDVVDIELKNKQAATVHIRIYEKPDPATGLLQAELYYHFIFEGTDLKIEDITDK